MNTCEGSAGGTRRSFRRARERLHATQASFEAILGGAPAVFVDTLHILADRLPVSLAVPVAGSFIRLFLLTGSALLPLKAMVLGSLSLAATFGTLVFAVRGGRLQWPLADRVNWWALGGLRRFHRRYGTGEHPALRAAPADERALEAQGPVGSLRL